MSKVIEIVVLLGFMSILLMSLGTTFIELQILYQIGVGLIIFISGVLFGSKLVNYKIESDNGF